MDTLAAKKTPFKAANLSFRGFWKSYGGFAHRPKHKKMDEELIDGKFVEKDTELIKKIPLSRVAMEDTLY